MTDLTAADYRELALINHSGTHTCAGACLADVVAAFDAERASSDLVTALAQYETPDVNGEPTILFAGSAADLAANLKRSTPMSDPASSDRRRDSMTTTAILATLGDWITEAEAAIAATVQGPNHPHLLRGDSLFTGPANVRAHARRDALIEARDLVASHE